MTASPQAVFLEPEIDDYEEDPTDAELEAVVRLLRADSSSAYLCGQHDKAQWLDDLVTRLEHHEHRERFG